MGKHTKLAAPAKRGKAAAVAGGGDSLARVEAHLERVLSLVEASIERGDANPALVRESAGLARAFTALSAEKRARDKHHEEADRRAARALNVPVVIAFLRQLDADGRRTVARELKRLEELADRSTSVLG